MYKDIGILLQTCAMLNSEIEEQQRKRNVIPYLNEFTQFMYNKSLKEKYKTF